MKLILTLKRATALEVAIPDTYPEYREQLRYRAAAEAWIARNKRRVQSESLARKWFRKTDKVWRGAPSQGFP